MTARHEAQNILVVGLGKSGVSAARWLAGQGAKLCLTDSRAEPPGFAELRAALPSAPFHVGGFAASEPLSHYDLAIVSPGVALDDPFVLLLHAANVEVVGDVELFARANTDPVVPVIGITGSNGKSTVTTLVGEMVHAAGLRAGVGGNLGTPTLDLLDAEVQMYVLELSSFQLETTHRLRCAAATVLNISPDHLDRHGTLQQYIAAKARLYSAAATAVVNRDDRATHTNAHLAQRIVSFGLDAPGPGHYGLRIHEGALWLACGETALLPVGGLKIEGMHNVANALAALALADAARVPREASLAALRAFRGLPHRCEWVADVGGVKWINDSKGTNVGATLAALEGLSGPLVWLGGGQGKGQDFTALRTPLKKKARVAILFGQDAVRIEQDLAGAAAVAHVADLAAAVALARDLAQPADRVLLSPACASFDQFRNYEDRGTRFRALVQGLAA